MAQEKIVNTIKKEEKVQMEYYATNKVYICGDKIYIKSSKSKRSITPKTINIGNGFYCNRITGEVKPFKKKTMRKVNMDVFFTIKRIIEANFSGGSNELFITLTYSGTMNDAVKLQNDFKAFWRKFKRKYPNCEYLKIVELNKKKSFHIHLLLKDKPNKVLFIPNDKLNAMWGNGNVNVQRIKSLKGLQNYFVPSRNASKKASDKFNLLKEYPHGFNIYSKSKGICVPKPVEMNLEEIEKLVCNYKNVYSQTKCIILTDEEGNKRLLNKFGFQEYVYNDSLLNQISKPELSEKGEEV